MVTFLLELIALIPWQIWALVLGSVAVGGAMVFVIARVV